MSIKLKLSFILSALALILAGCAHDISLKQLTSLNVDCATEEIAIIDDSVALNGEESWTAKCNGKTYACDYLAESDMGCYELKK